MQVRLITYIISIIDIEETYYNILFDFNVLFRLTRVLINQYDTYNNIHVKPIISFWSAPVSRTYYIILIRRYYIII